MKRINNKGVSLAELLAVVVVMGIVAAIAIPLVGRVIDSSKKKSYLSDLITVTESLRIYCQTESQTGKFINMCEPAEFTIENGELTNANFVPEMIKSSEADVFKKYLTKDPAKIADTVSYVYDGKKFYIRAEGKAGVHDYDTGDAFIYPPDKDSIKYISKVK